MVKKKNREKKHGRETIFEASPSLTMKMKFDEQVENGYPGQNVSQYRTQTAEPSPDTCSLTVGLNCTASRWHFAPIMPTVYSAVCNLAA